jgi:hypothetical protein
VDKIFGRTNGKYAMYDKPASINPAAVKGATNTASTAAPGSGGAKKKSRK